MQSARKVVLVPHSNKVQVGGSEERVDNPLSSIVVNKPKKPSVKSKAYEKIHNFIKIILKLARKVGYNDDLKIRLSDGTYLEKSNIVDLLNHAMTAGKVLHGENEFVDLLHMCGVTPDLIINENVKSKLIHLINKGGKPENLERTTSEDNKERPTVIKRRPSSFLDKLFEEERKAKRSKLEQEKSDEDASKVSVIKYAGKLKRKNDEEHKQANTRPRLSDIDDDEIDKDLWVVPQDN